MNSDEINDLLTRAASTPVELARLTEDLPLGSISTKPSPDEFSALENICHLRDIEIEGYAIRIQRVLAEDYPTLSAVDGAKLAIMRDYNKQDLNEALESFTIARKRNVAVLSAASETQFQRAGELEGVGRVTLQELLDMMCRHDEAHVHDLRIIRTKLLGRAGV